VLRFQKGAVAPETVALERIGGLDVLARHGEEDVLLIAVGSMVGLGLDVADRLTQQGIGVTVVDPRWVLPVDQALPPLAARYRLAVVVEDNGVAGGVATQVAAALRAERVPTAVRGFGVPQEFLDHASREQVLEQIGLTAQEVSREVVEHFARQDAALADLP
jgi:1-deoxy-D-xylulose-5-phosphate synthase